MLDCEDCMNYRMGTSIRDKNGRILVMDVGCFKKCKSDSKHFPHADVTCFKEFPFHHSAEMKEYYQKLWTGLEMPTVSVEV